MSSDSGFLHILACDYLFPRHSTNPLVCSLRGCFNSNHQTAAAEINVSKLSWLLKWIFSSLFLSPSSRGTWHPLLLSERETWWRRGCLSPLPFSATELRSLTDALRASGTMLGTWFRGSLTDTHVQDILIPSARQPQPKTRTDF